MLQGAKLGGGCRWKVPLGFLQVQLLSADLLASYSPFFLPKMTAPQEVPARPPEDLHLLGAQLWQVLQLQEAPQGA